MHIWELTLQSEFKNQYHSTRPMNSKSQIQEAAICFVDDKTRKRIRPGSSNVVELWNE
jgi:hypothetical protein